ncbi:MAG: AAA family ATPase [Nannocystaceae bacterium]|nr:ATP-binding protein [bacterium]
MSEVGTLRLVVGPVGAGKSTFARRRVADGSGVFFDLDPWMVRLFGDDARPKGDVLGWYLERRERCRGVMWDAACAVVRAGVDAYVELGLMTASHRRLYVERAQAEAVPVVMHLAEAPRDVRRARVLARNESGAAYVQVVPEPFFEQASDAWEPVTKDERSTVSTEDV